MGEGAEGFGKVPGGRRPPRPFVPTTALPRVFLLPVLLLLCFYNPKHLQLPQRTSAASLNDYFPRNVELHSQTTTLEHRLLTSKHHHNRLQQQLETAIPRTQFPTIKHGNKHDYPLLPCILITPRNGWSVFYCY